ncbi:MAG: DUF1844 domain-containing protein [Abditibacteriota bacterium]|nr:DUF1844 domain-containing protein [Abditibacteriota bacterium]MBP5738394.1 DUF1844 domain-containing protein [Abditibacteriota bacterium]
MSEEKKEQKIPELNIYNELTVISAALSQMAMCLMGIQLIPGQKEMKVDMEQAKVAIDAVDFLVKQIEPKLAPEQVREFHRIITDLQLNYAKRK